MNADVFKVVPTQRGVRVYRINKHLTPEMEVELLTQLIKMLEDSGCRVDFDFREAFNHKGEAFIDNIIVKIYRQAWWASGEWRLVHSYNDHDILVSCYHALIFKHEEPLSPTERQLY